MWHVETQTAAVLFFALAAMNVAAGDMVRSTIEAEYTATYDKFYACKEHDIAGKETHIKQTVFFCYFEPRNNLSLHLFFLLFKPLLEEIQD